MKKHLPALHRVILALSALLIGSVASAEDGVSPQPWLIGQNITLQAGRNDYGVAVLEGVQACLTQVNREGAVQGRKIVLQVLDDNNQADQAAANARQLITQNKVFILFGSIEGGPSTAVMKAAHKPGEPFSYGSLKGYVTARALVEALRRAGPNPTRPGPALWPV